MRESNSAVTTTTFRAVPATMNERPTSNAYSQPEQAAFTSNASARGTPKRRASALAADGTG